jgi:hypothetical protein
MRELTDTDENEAARRFVLELVSERMEVCPRCLGVGGVCFNYCGSRQVSATEAVRATRQSRGQRYADMRDVVMIRGYEMALSMLCGGMTERPMNLRQHIAAEYRRHIADLKDTVAVLLEGERGLAEFK